MEDRSARSRRRVDTLVVGEAEVMKEASEVVRRVLLRERRMMWDRPAEANARAVCWVVRKIIGGGVGEGWGTDVTDSWTGAEDDESSCHVL
jgi:hypothetical protein